MVNSYDHTNNFNLPLYKDNTPADFRDGYNSAMRSIDENMLNISTGINKANANLTALGADTPEKAATLATDIANGSNAHHLLTHMGINDDTSAGEHINAIKQNHTDTQNNTNALTALGAETVDKATTLKTTIGVAHLNASNNTDALTALGAETVDKATTLKNTINNKQDKSHPHNHHTPPHEAKMDAEVPATQWDEAPNPTEAACSQNRQTRRNHNPEPTSNPF